MLDVITWRWILVVKSWISK